MSIKEILDEIAAESSTNQKMVILAKYKDNRNVILPRKLEIYEDYVSKVSFLSDVKILFGTIFVVLKG